MDFFLLNAIFNFHTTLNSKHIVNFITFFTVNRLTKNYWNETVIFTGTHMKYSHMAHEFFTGSFQ